MSSIRKIVRDLVAKRKAAGLSVSEVARRIGVGDARTQILRYERGVEPKLYILIRWARALGVDVRMVVVPSKGAR